MPSIEYTSVDFPKGHPKVKQGIRYERFTWDDLIWAAITVGRGSWFDVIQYGSPSLYEIIFRACLLKTTLKVDGAAQRFFWTDAYRNLDPSEKGAISYFMGLTMCKLFAERFLNVSWLLHLDVYRAQLAPELFQGRSKPDLVGQSTSGEWVVFESKGRTSGPSAEDKSKAKTQARRLQTINTEKVTLGAALFSYFQRGELKVYWEDPEPDDEADHPISLRVSLTESVARYYEPFLHLVGIEQMTRQLERREPIRIQEADIELFFEPKILECLVTRDFALLSRLLYRDEKSVALFQQPPLPYKRDGIYTKAGVSWNQSKGQQPLFE